jgi:hypothetical protein
MTKSIYNLLEEIKDDILFETYPFYFIGGTALSIYLKHRISYDIDIISTAKLPVSAIKRFAYKVGATLYPSKNASTFRYLGGVVINKILFKIHFNLPFV